MTLQVMTHDSLQEQHTSQHRHFEQRVQAIFDLEYSRVYTSEPLRAPPHARRWLIGRGRSIYWCTNELGARDAREDCEAAQAMRTSESTKC